MSILEPFSRENANAGWRLLNAGLFLDTWVHAVTLQRRRLDEYPQPQRSTDSSQFARQLAEWLLTHSADVFMLALALEQVAEAARALRDAAPTEIAKCQIAGALERFKQACPDRRRVRHVLAHVGDYLHGKGGAAGGRGRLSTDYAWPDYDDALILTVGKDDDIEVLEIVFAEAVAAAQELKASIKAALA